VDLSVWIRKVTMIEKRLWKFLEDNPGQNAPWCEWQDVFAKIGSFDIFEKKYLQLTKQRVFAVNCRTDCGLNCPRKVIEYKTDDIVAVCPEHEERPYTLNKRDVFVYSLNRTAFYKSICSGFGIIYKGNMINAISGVCYLGDYTPAAGYDYPVYMLFKNNSDGVLEAVKNILEYTRFIVDIAKHIYLPSFQTQPDSYTL